MNLSEYSYKHLPDSKLKRAWKRMVPGSLNYKFEITLLVFSSHLQT
ncbi:hypothetical protein FHS68_001069 [Dyadobacter arcticus]|uniref:Uncharacterized protein n=1 Tax=Dyadobacter arcticus TaxID=1078754 RepID=A0ABX0UHE1_9BACT|nr:hypothetical protein [Dyadobacter arcticus]